MFQCSRSRLHGQNNISSIYTHSCTYYKPITVHGHYNTLLFTRIWRAEHGARQPATRHIPDNLTCARRERLTAQHAGAKSTRRATRVRLAFYDDVHVNPGPASFDDVFVCFVIKRINYLLSGRQTCIGYSRNNTQGQTDRHIKGQLRRVQNVYFMMFCLPFPLILIIFLL